MEEYDITWIEELLPPENTDGYREFGRRTDVRLATGEAHAGRFEFAELLTEGIVDVVQPNFGRCGGFGEAWFLEKPATTENALVRPHVWSNGVAAALQFLATAPEHLHVTAASPGAPLFKFDRSENPLRNELRERPFDPSGGTLAMPTGLGLGIGVDESAMETYRID